ncbi:hypothetical protein KF913_25180 [Candidatus Obscuribacterales bacterium]|nr:hypothetical protein [Candidatus Obscuribacterales bacterium]
MKSQIASRRRAFLSATAAHAEPLCNQCRCGGETGAKRIALLNRFENGDSILDVFTSGLTSRSSAKKALKYEGYACLSSGDTRNPVHYNSIPL